MRFTITGLGEVAQKHHIPAINKLNGEICEDGDIYVVTSPNFLHVPLTLYALSKGKRVILEKPIATLVKDAQILVDHPLADRIAVCYQRRFDTQACQIKRLSGQIESIKCEMFVRRDDPYWNTWRQDTRKSGGGALINIFIHYFDLLQWWLGPEYTVKFARIARKRGIDQFIYAELDFNGVPVTFTGSSLHSGRHNKTVVTLGNGKTVIYDKEDATHYDVYKGFLTGNKRISVKKAIVSLKIVEDIYNYDAKN